MCCERPIDRLSVIAVVILAWTYLLGTLAAFFLA
jgi:hypothetical protein